MGILEGVFVAVVFIYSVVVHEVSHGIVANSLGDDTAKNAGRLTLNPLKHLDMFGSVILPLLLILARSSFVFGYAKPVPHNPANLTDLKFGSAKVALAGPASNLVLAVLFGLFLRFLPSSLESTALPLLISFIVRINLLLAIFNLAPIPPLDGHWLLLAFLPNRFAALKLFLMRYGLVLFFIFLIFIFPFVYPLINLIFRLIVG
ncbi:MAG: site-2 protease family protein [Candidatus Yanofskybacteria bacterium]|nr:site-2 protease family protein [Candidatus Yanofskybacteria bacterium]